MSLILWASAEPRPVELVVRARARWALRRERVAARDHTNNTVRRDLAEVGLEREVDHDAKAPQQCWKVSETRKHLVKLKVVRLR